MQFSVMIITSTVKIVMKGTEVCAYQRKKWQLKLIVVPYIITDYEDSHTI